MAKFTLYIFFLLLPHLMFFLSAKENHENQPCSSFHCGKLGYIDFPFNNKTNPECGLYTVDCKESIQKIQLKKGGHWFQIYDISLANSISINIEELHQRFDSYSCKFLESLTLPSPSFASNILHTLTILNCSKGSLGINSSLYLTCEDYYNNTFNSSSPQCSTLQLPTDYLDIQAKRHCFNCIREGGQCSPDGKDTVLCSTAGKEHDKLGLKLGLGIGCPALTLCLVIFLLLRRYKRKHTSSSTISRNSFEHFSNSNLEGGSICLGIPVFSYIDLEEATNNFDSNRELGDGGFGTVYHGILKDGREVAVKRLYEHNCKRLQHFMNEIVILARLRHKYLVSLYGCTSRHSRELLLVYEYIPNGTVADHLHGDRAKNGHLTWPIRMSIAIETATALTYLHASDIIHRDVKTNNILLDNNFCVKVADFGLARLFPNNVTHISTAPQGTPGYVDPAYHQCYQLTSKSDVYSFGVVLVELISSKPAVDITRHTDEINLANLAINKIQKCAINELVDPSIGAEIDNEVRRKIIAVAELAFLCLQQDKEMRPSMNAVLEELKRIHGKNEPDDHIENGEGAFDGVMSSSCVQAQSSPNNDDVVGLLNSKKPQTSPISVTHKWSSGSSTTQDVST